MVVEVGEGVYVADGIHGGDEGTAVVGEDGENRGHGCGMDPGRDPEPMRELVSPWRFLFLRKGQRCAARARWPSTWE